MPSQYDMIHISKNKYTIGSIDDFVTNEIEEVTISTNEISKVGVVKISVYGGEGPVPHFHIEGKDFSCCVCIFDNRYFDHGIHQDILNTKQLKELDRFMRDKSSINEKLTNWEAAKFIWEAANIENNDDISMVLRYKLEYKNKTKQPDYTKIDGYKRN